ncbi:MAG: vWA domain-containing protein, partial [Gammaproteobacteria bacterium]
MKKLLLLLVSIFYLSVVQAYQSDSKPVSDVRVIVDISGSMKKNDPNNLRIPAIQLFSQLLPPDSQSGVWTFGQYVNMLVPLSEVTPEWKAEALRTSKQINSVGLFTNISGAIERASFDWSEADPDTKRSLVLLTDGMVDISKDPAKNAEAREELLNTLLPRLKQAGVTIHTIALSN